MTQYHKPPHNIQNYDLFVNRECVVLEPHIIQVFVKQQFD